MNQFKIIKANLDIQEHQETVLMMLNAYASDPMGDGKELLQDVQARLIDALRAHPTTLIFLAYHRDSPVGIATCFLGFSTFAAKQLINIHDLYVVPEQRGNGVARKLLAAVEGEAHELDCCKLTLEVQELNERAYKAYLAYGFARSTYAEEAGGAHFLSKQVV